MFKAVSTPLPNLKDWRFSVDQWGIGWAEFDREGESQNSFGRRPFEELAQIVAKVEQVLGSQAIQAMSKELLDDCPVSRVESMAQRPTCWSAARQK